MGYRRRCAGSMPWLSHSSVYVLAVITAAVVGCGAVSYKAGGTGGDYQAARDRCQKKGRTEGPDFDQCMEEQGWKTTQFGAPATPSDAKKSISNESPSPVVPAPPAPGAVAPASKSNDGPSAKSNDPVPADQPIVVKNWFKLGGTAGDLAAAKQRCATKLGVADRPDPESDVVTSEMLDCLRDEGWRGF